MTQDRLKRLIASLMKQNGFRKGRASTWYLDQQDCIFVINLQRSRFGPQYYINLGAYYKEYGDEGRPKEECCHVRTRLDSLTNHDIARALNLDDQSIEDSYRISWISECVNTTMMDYFESINSLHKVKHLIKCGELKNSFVHRILKE